MKRYFKSLRRITGGLLMVAVLHGSALFGDPNVEIQNPANGSTWKQGSTIGVRIQATDPTGAEIEKIEVFLDGALVDTATLTGDENTVTVPVSLPAVGLGNFVISADATNDVGVVGSTSSTITAVLAPPYDETLPRIFIDHPLPLGGGDTVNDVSVASGMFINAVVTDDVGITSVQFEVDGQPLAGQIRQIGDVYSIFYAPSVAGTYQFVATATDTDGNTVSSEPMFLSVGPLERPFPITSLFAPVTETRVGEPIGIFADANGRLIPIDRIDFFANGVLIGSTNEPLDDTTYGVTWVPPEDGDYEIQARIVQIDPAEATYDNWNITDPILISVNPDSGLVPIVTLDAGDVTQTVLNPIVLQAEVDIPFDPGDPDGPIIGVAEKVVFYKNGVNIGEDETYPYSITYTPPAPGGYQFAAELIMDNGKSYSSGPVNRRLLGSQPASVTIDSPVDGTSVIRNSPVLITASATSTGGSEMILSFYANGVKIGEDNTYPYNLTWNSQSTGTFELKVEAIETESGALAASDEITVVVTDSSDPQIQSFDVVKFDAQSSIPTVGSDVVLELEASDSDGFVSSVEFFVNGVSLGDPDITEPFTSFWRPGVKGDYTVTALVVDNSGNQVVATKQIEIGEPVGLVPRLTLGVTASGNVTPGSRVVVRANVFDDDPSGLKVRFLLNGQDLGEEDTEEPYSVIIDPEVGSGNTYSLTAVAFDNDGNSRADILSPLYISDVSVDQPAIDIISLAEGDQLTLGSRAPIRVVVSGGAANNIENVVFYADGVEIGRDNTAPYALDWIPDRIGTIQISAATLLGTKVYDHDNDRDTPFISVTPVNVSTPVNVDVNPAVGILPSISLDILPQSTNLAVGSKLLLYADAQDLDGQVSQVEFFLDGQSLGTDTTAPFTHILTTAKQGDFDLNALATDSSGNVVTSTFVNLVVTPRVITQTPGINLTVPNSGQEGSILSLRASTEGFITPPEAVVFYANGQTIGSSDETPYSLSWLANLDGDVTFFASARQELDDGVMVTTVSDVVESSLSENNPPVISSVDIDFPNQSATKPDPLAGELLTFTINVQDTGPIRSVELLRDGDPIGQSDDTATPFEITDTPPGLGDYVYSVVVTDRGGLQAQSAQVPVSVVVGQSPTVQITAPAAGSEFRPNNQVNLRVAAEDPDGFVAEVTLQVNGIQVGEVLTSAPFEAEFIPVVPGDYEVVARARDNSGNLTISTPLAFTVVPDNPPQFSEFGNDLPGTVARIGQTITWTLDVTDDFGLESVQLFRDGTEVPTTSPIPIEVTDTLNSIGRFRYFAEATDTAGNVTRSSTVEVSTTRGTPPVVSIVEPVSGSSYNLIDSVTLRASAVPAQEPAGEPLGTIASVEFFLNGNSRGVVTQAPFIIPSVTLGEGTNIVTAIATSDTGLTAMSSEITVFGVDGTVPEIVRFSSDATGNQSLVGEIVTFEVTATDENGIAEIELLLGGEPIDGLPAAKGSPASFEFVPDAPGTYTFSARATNVNDLQVVSDPLEITVRFPDPLGSNSDFVLQTFIDLLMRNPTPVEQADYASRLDSGDLTRARFIRELINPADGQAESDYDAVRGALLANRFLLGTWPSREDLENDTGAARDGGLVGLVASFMVAFEETYKAEVNADGVPDILSMDSEIGAYVAYLFELKYGVPPNGEQLNLAKLHFRASGRDQYTASFISDVEVIATSNGWVTSLLGFKFPSGGAPDDTYLREADAASLLINFLRVVPSDEEVSELAPKLFATQVDEIVSDPRYADRFVSTFETLENHASGWKRSDWFGWFNTGSAPWVWHSEQGWVALDTTGQAEDNLWYYDSKMGWMWTASDIYPNVYSSSRNAWLYSARGDVAETGSRWFYDYKASGWASH